MKVKVQNYMLPLIFSYKGWQVTISDDSGFFTLADMKVRVEIKIAAWQYASALYKAYEEQLGKSYKAACRRGQIAVMAKWELGGGQPPKEAFSYYLKLAERFAEGKRVEYSFSVNGGMFDRFMGQNISAVDKAKQQVITYIDNNLGNAWELFLKSIQK